MSIQAQGTNGAVSVNGADISARGVALCRVKAGDTDRSNTVSADPDLTLTFAATGTYDIEACLLFTGLTTGTQGINLQFAVSGGGTINSTSGTILTGSVNGASTGPTLKAVQAANYVFATITTGGAYDMVTLKGQVQVLTNTITLFINWGANSAGNNTRMGRGSYMKAMQLF